MTTPSRRVFVVMAHYWYYNDETTVSNDRPLKGFTDREQAEQYCDRLERRERARIGQDDDGYQYTIVEMDLGGEEDQS